MFDLTFQKLVLVCFLCFEQDWQKKGQGREEDSGQPGESVLGRPSAGGEFTLKSWKKENEGKVGLYGATAGKMKWKLPKTRGK